LTSCVAKANGCCAVYFVPVKAGEYQITDASCSGPLGTVAVNGTVAGTLDAYTPAVPPPNLASAQNSTWPSWETATQIDIALGVLSWLQEIKPKIKAIDEGA
jgi:hypothetical protein